MPVTYEKIATAEVTTNGTTSVLEIANIPATYTDLVLYVQGRVTGASTAANVQAYGALGSSANIAFAGLGANGEANTASADTGSTEFYARVGSGSAAANQWGSGRIYFANYKQSTGSIPFGGLTVNTNTVATYSTVVLVGGNWYRLDAITTIRMSVSTTYVIGSQMQLYGIKTS